MKEVNSMFDCIVIGAGPGGLVTTKELLEQGVTNIICLEQAETVGGVFANTYDNLVLTSSCTYSMFSDFWMGDGNQQEFWTKHEVVDYWKRYAQHFGVLDKIRLNSKVVAVTPQDNGGWTVQIASGETFDSKRIALAIGNNSIPSYPQWKDSLTDVEFSHSKQYRNADDFVGKNVLVVGGGESGSDVALEISRVAKNCWVSLRSSTGWVTPRKRGERAADIATHRGLYGLPKEYGSVFSQLISEADSKKEDAIHDAIVELNNKVKAQNRIWGTYGTKTLSLPKAIVHHGCKVVSEILKVEDGGKTLTTAEGETLTNIDAVVFCTGYKNYISFLPDQIKQIDPRTSYKHMFHTQYGDKIVWIGWARPGFGSQFPIMEMQARLFSLICTEQLSLPTYEEMQQTISKDREKYLQQFEHNATRIRSLIDYHTYMDDIAELIGCKPPLWQYFFFYPHLWLRIVYGATQATQFRLQGLGQKPVLARKLIAKLPISPFNHVVKAGLKGRVIYAFKALGTKLLAPLNWFKGSASNLVPSESLSKNV
ncbi:MAG: flavin-containing monooxygenase [Crocosphaera sp.]